MGLLSIYSKNLILFRHKIKQIELVSLNIVGSYEKQSEYNLFPKLNHKMENIIK